MTADAAAWYCLSCGSPAAYWDATMDARHPLVVCQREPYSCGRVLGTRNTAELAEALAANRQARADRDHAKGRHLRHPGRYCRACAAEGGHRAHVADRAYDAACPECRAARARTRPAVRSV